MAKMAEEKGLSADHIMPTMDDVDVFPREAAAVAMKAIEQGLAKFTDVSFEQEYEYAKKLIMRARGVVQDAMATGYIALPKGNKPPRPSKQVIAAVKKLKPKSGIASPARRPKARHAKATR
jgi:hypothetical protein